MGKKWIGHARLLAEVPSTSIEYCEVYKIPKRAGFLWVPWSLGPLFIPTCGDLIPRIVLAYKVCQLRACSGKFLKIRL